MARRANTSPPTERVTLLIRKIVGFHQDKEGDWVAQLSCLHSQHVRHQPPFFERPWVQVPSGRTSAIGAVIECPLCDRAELPEGLHVVRTAGPFDAHTLPAGLRRAHRIADGNWGYLRVLEGAAELAIETDPPIRIRLEAGESQPIPPGVPHAVSLQGPAHLAIDFLTKAEDSHERDPPADDDEIA